MKKITLTQIIISVIVGIGLAFIAYATNSFPTSENNWTDGDVIESDWANQLEYRIGANATTSKSSLTYQVNQLMGTSTLPNLVTIGTISTGVWQGTSIADAYIDNDITASNYLTLSDFYATTTHSIISSLPSLSITASQISDLSHFDGSNFFTYFSATTTDYLTEGSSNLYMTEAGWAGYMAGTTTDALSVGSTNLYFTNALADARINATSSIDTLTSLLSLTNASTTQLTVSDKSWLGTILGGIWNGTAIANSYLANSTISGIALGGTLGALTATDTTLTFSGSYDGSVARTVGLNLGNGNTWTGLQQFGNATSTQLTVSGDSWFNTIKTGIWNGTKIDIGDYTNLTAGTNITLTGDDLSVDDAFLSNSADDTTTGNITATEFIASDAAATSTLKWTSIAGAVSILGEYFTNFTTYVRSLFTGGNHITITAGSIAVDDDFLLNTGDIGTGVYDFGGADSFEIPNGANPTVDATGETAVNTTTASSSLRYYDGTAERALYADKDFGFTIASSTVLAMNGFTASSTIALGFASKHGETHNEITCIASTGVTAQGEIGDGTNWENYILITSTRVTTTLSTNNTFTPREQRFFRIGQIANLDGEEYITCSINKINTAD